MTDFVLTNQAEADLKSIGIYTQKNGAFGKETAI
jgi:hypothetical protein